MKTILFGSWVAVISVGLARAQGKIAAVEAHTLTATDAAHADSTLKMAVLAEVASGYHIEDHKPTLDYLIPTDLKLESNAQITVKNVVYPKGTLRKFTFSDTPLSVYEGEVVVGALLQVAKAAPVGAYALKGKLAYQACNEHACLPPSSVPLEVTVKVVPRNVPLKQVDSDVFRRIPFD